MSHGGGCGCKIPRDRLRALLARQPPGPATPALLAGLDAPDDAAVWRLDARRALIATTDFFTPIVDDPRDFGRIAAANALSDVYAMGGQPLFALNLLAAPCERLPEAALDAILDGGRERCAAAGAVVAGGHSIDIPTPLYGLAVVGEAPIEQIVRAGGAAPGDALILSKPLGVGVLATALKRSGDAGAEPGACNDAGAGAGNDAEDAAQDRAADYAALLDCAVRLNLSGPALAAQGGVHAMTDVTGFGLLGHLAQLCRASGVDAELNAAAVPLIERAAAHARRGVATGAARRNLASTAACRSRAGQPEDWRLQLLADPQTNGGLLIACDAAARDAALAQLRADGCAQAAVIGRLRAGDGAIRWTA